MTSEQLRDYCTRTALQIWRDHAEQHAGKPGASLMPLLLGDYQVGADLLIVGMNPSFSEDPVEGILRKSGVPESDVSSFFAWDPTLDMEAMQDRVAKLGQFEAVARAEYKRYFGPLDDFARNIGAAPPAHIDMFLMRHTSQKDFQNAYGKTFDELKLVPFALKQFELFSFTLKAMLPKVVVIANAAASDVAVKGLPLTHWKDGRSYRWNELPDVPFFLSGMLSGQRALDRYSRNRLALDVKAAMRAVRN